MSEASNPQLKPKLRRMVEERLGPEKEKAMVTFGDLLREEGRQQGIEIGMKEGIARGREEGIARGRVEGRVDGQRLALLRLLEARFGSAPSPDVEERIRAADEVTLGRILQRMFTATTPQEVVGL